MTDSAIIAIGRRHFHRLQHHRSRFGTGKAAAAAMESIARQPDAAGEIRLLAHHLDGHDGGSHHLRPADRLYARRQGLRGTQL